MGLHGVQDSSNELLNVSSASSGDLIKWNSPSKAKSESQSHFDSMLVGSLTSEDRDSENKQSEEEEPSSNNTPRTSIDRGGGRDLSDEDEGILGMKMPDTMSEGSGDSRLQEGGGECLLEDEDYYASLFFRCDLTNCGRVRASALLQSIRELKALGIENTDSADHSFSSVESSNEDLEGLRNVLDPDGQDSLLQLRTFRDGINAYVKFRRWFMSPVKGGHGMMNDSSGFGFPRSSSPHRRDHGGRGEHKRLDLNLNLSQLSGENGEGPGDSSSLEAFVGSNTTGDSMGLEGRDYLAEISDWELRLQKAMKDNTDLKARLRDALHENVALMDGKEALLNEHEVTGRVTKARIQRLEGEVQQRNGTIASLEDRVTTLNHSQSRLENQLTLLQKENKELICENTDLKEELRRKMAAAQASEDIISRLKKDQSDIVKECEVKGGFLKDQNEQLARSLQELELKLEALEAERAELKTTVKELTGVQDGRSPPLHKITDASFDLDVSQELDDIQTELLRASSDFQSFQSMTISQSSPTSSLSSIIKYDVAVQCEQNAGKDVGVECALLTQSYSIEPEMLLELLHLTREVVRKHKGIVEQCRLEESAPGEPSSLPAGEVANPRSNGSNGTHPKAASIDEQNMTSVVREIHEELLDFRNQLKKSQELLNFINHKSSQSLSLTKSCPGLAILEPGAANGAGSSDLFKVSISTQTDSPQVETPILNQKLNLISPILSDSADSHNSFDKLSDDGSVRVRDDLSIVLELSEQETDGNPADIGCGDRMSAERGNSLGGSRPKLKRMANAAVEDEEHQTDKSSRGEREDDNVSVTSSQGESVYLSLERPLKVTVKGEDDRSSSGAYRSCHSSLILLGAGGGSNGRGRIPHADSDTASVISEGNTTFGSPFSSPSSPYWTPSQGSSSQETLTPLDGDRTPVNHEEEDRRSSASGERAGSSAFHSPTDIGRIPESKMDRMMQLAFDCTLRSVIEDGQLLNKQEWRGLRDDVDRRLREEYNHAFAQEVGNEDAEGAVGLGVEGVGPRSHAQYAFRHDEEAEAYLELMPDLAEKLFNCFDVVREKRESLTPEDLQDLERKFNHMAEVFQTEHTNLEQRISLLTNNLKESQDSLKSMSKSLKNCLVTLEEYSRQNGPGCPSEGLLEITNSLSHVSEEFDLYSTAMCRNARRLGMMDVQNRLHRMMEVIILYVHMLKGKHDQQNEEYRLLNTNFRKAMDLLEDHKVAFVPALDGAGGSHPINNNELKRRLWDESEMENIEGERWAEGVSSRFQWILHLLRPTNTNNGSSPPEKPTPKEIHSRNPLIRFLSKLWEVLRWNLFWPWNAEKTMTGLKEAFAVVLMITAVFAIFWRFFPSANGFPMDSGCYQTGYFKSVDNYFRRCGHLNYDTPQPI